MRLLPDLPGKVTGIKSTNPWVVQCPKCGNCFAGDAPAITLLRLVPFSTRAPEMGRMCLGCWADRGWYEGFYDKARDAGSEFAHRLLDRDYPGWDKYRISVEEAETLIGGGAA